MNVSAALCLFYSEDSYSAVKLYFYMLLYFIIQDLNWTLISSSSYMILWFIVSYWFQDGIYFSLSLLRLSIYFKIILKVLQTVFIHCFPPISQLLILLANFFQCLHSSHAWNVAKVSHTKPISLLPLLSLHPLSLSVILDLPPPGYNPILELGIISVLIQQQPGATSDPITGLTGNSSQTP